MADALRHTDLAVESRHLREEKAVSISVPGALSHPQSIRMRSTVDFPSFFFSGEKDSPKCEEAKA